MRQKSTTEFINILRRDKPRPVRYLIMNEGHFDYKVVSEERDDLDFEKLVPCPHCKKPIPQDATICLYCGQEAVWRKKSPWVAVIVVFLIITFLLLLLKST